jgi:hypothetical protein
MFVSSPVPGCVLYFTTFVRITGISVTGDIAIDDISLHSCDFHDYTETLSDGTTCPVGQGVVYTGCKAGVPAPYNSCKPCGGKTVGPCASGPVCQVLHGPIPSTGMNRRKETEGHRKIKRERERERVRALACVRRVFMIMFRCLYRIQLQAYIDRRV